jgi:hypothetical protein
MASDGAMRSEARTRDKEIFMVRLKDNFTKSGFVRTTTAESANLDVMIL